MESFADEEDAEAAKTSEYTRIKYHMDLGDELRRTYRDDALALAAMAEITRLRGDPPHPELQAYLLHSLKHPDEAFALKSVYGSGFFLLGVYSSKEKCINQLRQSKGLTREDAEELVERDEKGESDSGQQTTLTFQMADAFVSGESPNLRHEVSRIISVLFGDHTVTPTIDEWAMYLAFASSTRSADLSRQVGAVLLNENGDLISVGANDVPRFGGGLYWGDDGDRDRDLERGYDANEKERDKIVGNVMSVVQELLDQQSPRKQETHQAEVEGETGIVGVGIGSSDDSQIPEEPGIWDRSVVEETKRLLKGTGLFDITEYGRSVHAEMDAITSCARTRACSHGGSMYVTTFPCHNCAKHIVASGIREVVYIEPYPKSKAFSLHSDSVSGVPNEGKVLFRPFSGIGPRRYFDLFSLRHGSGYAIERKEDGVLKQWTAATSSFRTPIARGSYMDSESIMVDMFNTWRPEEKQTETKLEGDLEE
jgi:deoxycytidylate deaminase